MIQPPPSESHPGADTGAIRAGADMSRLRDAPLLRAHTWWQSLPRQRGAAQGLTLPDRTEIDPLAIPDLLPHVVLWAVLHQPDGGLRYRCRLAGTGMVEVHGHEFTGQWMEEFHGAENARIQPEYDFVSRSGQPHYVERSLFWMNRDYRRYRRLLLPFGDASATHGGVAKILNVAHFLTA
ncbi:PAS domain-containing protein [Ferrovibrio terrae]|nr:PAS domain-containing protein [Ferrovibrio terrae]